MAATYVDGTRRGWWLEHVDGRFVTHVYRFIDDDQGKELVFPDVGDAMSDMLRPNEVVNFNNESVRNLAMQHNDKCSEVRFGTRCFLSTTLDIHEAMEFGRRKKQYYRDRELACGI